jgi:hypothetical protein
MSRKKYKPKPIQGDKRQSPAHDSQKRVMEHTYVYTMHSMFYFWKSKWGISDKPEQRRGSVDADVIGDVFFIIPPQRIPFGWRAEQFVHRLYAMQHAPMKKGTGRTEWFLNLNPIVGAVVIWVSISCDISLPTWAYALSVFCPIIWLDGLFWLMFFRAFWISVTGLIFFIAYQILVQQYGF